MSTSKSTTCTINSNESVPEISDFDKQELNKVVDNKSILRVFNITEQWISNDLKSVGYCINIWNFTPITTTIICITVLHS